MAIVPVKFQRPQTPFIPTASLAEFASGKGIALLYAGDEDTRNNLSTAVTYGNIGATNVGNGSTIDLDFDLKVLKPIILEGDASISFALLSINTTGSGGVLAPTITATIRHWDGTTETDLDTNTITMSATVGANSATEFRRTLDLNIPRTKFKVGETIRLNMLSNTATSGNEVTLAHDPKNRTTVLTSSAVGGLSWTDTELIFLMPFVIV